jgi:hypothetical protein
VRTAKDGRALVTLPPGRYRIRPLIIHRHNYDAASPPEEITVEPDHFDAVIVDYEGPLPG